MLIALLNAYLIFILALSFLIVALLFLKKALPSLRILVPFVIVLVLLPLLGGYLYIAYFSPLPDAIVPDVQGMPLASALERLEAFKLKGLLAGTVFDMRFPEGEVVSQQPEGGRKVKAGRVVSLVASSGMRKVKIPNLLGRTLDQAEAVLNANGLLLGEVSRDFAPELDPGIVLMQKPLPDEEVDSQSFVEITISATSEAREEKDEKKEEKTEGGFRLW